MSKFLALIVVASSSLAFASCGEKESAASAPSAAGSKASAPAGPSLAAPSLAAAPAAQDVEAGCAGCVFHMEGAEGCQLAVKVDGKPYYVSGVEMPGHESGLCDGSKMAVVAGKVEGDRFVATSFALKP